MALRTERKLRSSSIHSEVSLEDSAQLGCPLCSMIADGIDKTETPINAGGPDAKSEEEQKLFDTEATGPVRLAFARPGSDYPFLRVLVGSILNLHPKNNSSRR